MNKDPGIYPQNNLVHVYTLYAGYGGGWDRDVLQHSRVCHG